MSADAFSKAWVLVKSPFEDHDWAQGSPTAESRYRELESQMGESGADAAYSNPDLVEVMEGLKEMVRASESGMSGMSTRNSYGAYMGLIPKLARSMGTNNQGAATYLLMAGANPKGIADAMMVLRGG
jgi:hypothetical protein